MSGLRFELVNVFGIAGEPFSGNPLAVITADVPVPDVTMQAWARQFNLSETTFVCRVGTPERVDAAVRIFTPTVELPFAGHPTLGTAYCVAAALGRDAVTLGMPAGHVPVRLTDQGWQLQAPQGPAWEHEATAQTWAQALSLPDDAVPGPAYRVAAGVDLPKRFSNTRPALKTFIRRVLKGSERRGPRTRTPERHDSRGVVAKNAAKSQTRLTPERRAELVADYEAGMPVRMIAAKYAVHRGTVPTLVTKDGARLRTSGLSLTGRAHAASLYAEGLTLREVAERLGVDEKTVRNAVVEERGLIRPRGRRPHEARRDSSA
jgi:DNA-binding NarL/FixJ family response regulator